MSAVIYLKRLQDRKILMEPSATNSIIKKSAAPLFANRLVVLLAAFIVFGVAGLFLLPWAVEKTGHVLSRVTKGSAWEISYQSLWPSYLKGELIVYGLEIKGPGVEFAIDKTVVNLDLMDFLKKRRIVESLEEVRLSDVKITLNHRQSSSSSVFHLSKLPDALIALDHSIMISMDGCQIGEGEGLFKSPETILFLMSEAGHFSKLALHSKISEREIHGSLLMATNSFSGKLFVWEQKKVVDDIAISGFYHPESLSSQLSLVSLSNHLQFSFEERAHDVDLVYEHQVLPVGYWLGWLGFKEIHLGAAGKWLMSQWGSKITDEKNFTKVKITKHFVDSQKENTETGLKAAISVYDPYGSEGLNADVSQSTNNEWLFAGAYRNARGGLIFSVTQKSNGWAGDVNLDGLGFGAGRDRARIHVDNVGRKSVFYFSVLDNDVWLPSFEASLEETTNGRHLVIPSGNPSGLTLDLFEKENGKGLDFKAGFKEFALKIPSEILNLGFVREGSVTGDLVFHYDKLDGVKLESDLEIFHTVTQDKILTARFDLDAQRFTVRELLFPLGEKKLRLFGKGTAKANDTKFLLAYSYGESNQGVLRGESEGNGLSRIIRLYADPIFQSLTLNFDFKNNLFNVLLLGLYLGKSRLDLSGQMELSKNLGMSGYVTLGNPNPYDPSSKLTGQFVGDLKGLDFQSLKYTDDQNNFSGNGKITWKEKLAFQANFGDLEDKMTAEFSGELVGSEIKSALSIKQLRPERIKNPLQGILKGNLRLLGDISGKINSPTINLRAYLENLALPGGLYSLYTEVTRYKNDWEFQRLELARPMENSERQVLLKSSGKFLHTGAWSVKYDLTQAPLLWQTSGVFQMNYDPVETKGELTCDSYVIDDKTENKLSTIFEKIENVSNTSWVFHSPSANGIEGIWKTENRKKLTKTVKATALFFEYRFGREALARLEGEIVDGKWDVTLTTDRFRLGLLKPLMPLVVEESGRSETFSVIDGKNDYRNVNLLLKIQNTDAGVMLNGKMLATGRVKLVGQAEGQVPFRAELAIEDNRFTIKKGEMTYADGTKLSVGGSILSKSLRKIEEYDLRILNTGSGIPVQYATGFFNLKGKANLDVRLTGSGYYPHLAGKMGLNGTTIAIEKGKSRSAQSWEDKQRKFFNRVDWDLLIASVSGAKSHIESPLFDLAVEPDSSVNLRGSFYNDSYAFSGTVMAKSGTYTHLGSDFTVKNLVMTFPKNENGFNPFMDLLATLQVRDSDLGGNVEITLEKKSRVFESESYSLRASPDRKPDEIKALLGLGDSRTASSQSSQSKAVASSRLMAQNIVLRPLERSIRRTLGIDLFHIDTDLLSLASGSTNQSTSSVNTTVSFGKYLGENLFLQSDINFGLGKTNVFGGTIGLEYDLKYFNFGGKLQLNDLQQLYQTGTLQKPVDLSIRLNKSWNF
jgi:hypothetical protein